MKNILLIFVLFITCHAVSLCQTNKKEFAKWYADENKVITLTGKANTKLFSGNYKGAMQDYTRIIKQFPKSSNAYLARGLAKNHHGDYNGAIEDYNKAIELNSAASSAFVHRGRAKINISDKEGACLDWNTALELGDTDATDLIEEHCK